MAPESPNVQLVKDVFARLISDDRESALELVHSEAEICTRISSVTGVPYCGIEGVRQWFRDTDEQYSRCAPELRGIEELKSGRVLVAARVEVRGRESELPWAEDVYYVVRVEEGRLRKLQMYLERDEALEAAAADE